MARLYPSDIIEQGRAVLEACQSTDPQLKFGEVTVDAFDGRLTKVEPLEKQIDKLDAQLTDLRNQRDTLHNDLWQMLTRVRGGMRAIYVADSSQYEMVGGTRTSERKPVPRRKAAPKS